tara:strand:+ start:857 stop:1108 length:252 start_codon:yes stop_codon:yes gene_type:complete
MMRRKMPSRPKMPKIPKVPKMPKNDIVITAKISPTLAANRLKMTSQAIAHVSKMIKPGQFKNALKVCQKGLNQRAPIARNMKK